MTDKEMDDVYNQMSKEELQREYEISKDRLDEAYNELPAHILKRGREEFERFKKLIAPLKEVYIRFPDETPEFFFELKKAEAEVIYTMEIGNNKNYYYNENLYYSATNYFKSYVCYGAEKLYSFLSLKGNYPIEYQIESNEGNFLWHLSKDIMIYEGESIKYKEPTLEEIRRANWIGEYPD